MSDANAERQPGLNFELPPQPTETGEVAADQKQERLPSAPESSGNRPAAATAMPAPAPSIPIPSADPVGPTNQVVTASPPQPTYIMPAADVDLIEKHWVDKAKAIVDQTRDDPFKQKNALSREATDYKQTRFNKGPKPSTAT